MGYSKGKATGYTDYYKNNTYTPSNTYGDTESETNDYTSVPATPEERRKAAIRRRLKMRKVGK